MSDSAQPSGPDLAQGIPLADLGDGAMVLGHVGDDAVLVARRGSDVFAVGATCTHWGGPLAEGLMVDDTVRCPWHHACFSLRTGEALRAPALDPIACWSVEVRDGRAYLGRKMEPTRPQTTSGGPESVVIVGGGAAGNAAAEILRREGYSGSITMLSADAAPPCDRPNLSKGYLAGTVPPEYTLLRPAEFYKEHRIELKLGVRVTNIDTSGRQLALADGSRVEFGALLLATGADVVRLDLPGSNLPHVHYLRTLADCDSLIAKAATSKRAVVVGASFIGLEVTAALRARDIEVHVVAPDPVPMQKILGPEVGAFIRSLHEEHGVTFHLETVPVSIDESEVTLKNGERLTADFVVIGVGVRPALALAEQAGLALDRGVTVNEYLETSVPGVFAAGDIARWPDPHTGERIRVEHWVVAERQGQTAARNILGKRERFDAVPFFWTDQYDLTLVFIGHAERWDKVELQGQLGARDCAIAYQLGGRKIAAAFIHRDIEALRTEVELERSK